MKHQSTGPRLYTLQHVPADSRGGELTIAEFEKHLPFNIKQTLFMHALPLDATRGEHAHKAKQQFAICLHGEIEAKTQFYDTEETYQLDSIQKGLHIPPMTWISFTSKAPNTIMVILGSDVYDEEDYIRDPAEYQKLIKQ